jgi:predicted dehydrogenase
LSPLRLGIIGAGFGHRVHLPVLRSTPGVEVAVLCTSGNRKPSSLPADVPALRLTNRWQDLAADPMLDACVVAVPPAAQREIVCGLLQAGKHVLSEKPFGLTLEDARAMLRAAQASGRVHTVDFQFRVHPGIRRMKELLANATLGPLERLDVLWLSGGRADPVLPFSWQHDRAAGGGILNSYASHTFDYVEWLAGEPIVELFARTDILIPARPDSAGQLVPVTAEDSCDCVARLASGALVNIKISNCHRHGPGHRIEAFGRLGALRFHQPQFAQSRAFTLALANGGVSAPVAADGPAEWDNHAQGVARVVAAFLLKVRGADGAEPDADFHAGLRSQMLVQAALQSARERRAVAVSAT